MEMDFNVVLKRIQQEGNLVWEYNPLRNYRLDQDMLYYKDRLYTYLDFLNEYVPNWSVESDFEDTEKGAKDFLENYFSGPDYSWYTLGLSKTFTPPVVYQKGQLVDFITDEFDYDLNHPISLLPSYSYDDSVDLIINDGKNQPRLINSRFSSTGKNRYQIVNRRGDNDTNIYDKGTQFNIDTSLYKITTSIPEITFAGISYGGNLKIGNYFFYFKYADADGNESDFIGSSGLVSIFIGNSPQSIHSGFENQNSSKKIKFLIENTDNSYQDLIVYYTRASSGIYENASVEAFKILQKYKIQGEKTNQIIITGFEESVRISDVEINQMLQTYTSAQTHTFCQNRLFLGNVVKEEENYDKLLQCALYITPSLDTSIKCDVDKLSENYSGNTTNTYYNPSFIYNHVGYWDDELYRFGVVFIKSDNTLSFVYNVRGLRLSTDPNVPKTIQDLNDKFNLNDKDHPFNPEYHQIKYSDYTFKIDQKYKFSNDGIENSKGVCYIPHQNLTDVIGIKFKIPKYVKEYLQNELNIKGLFFVRQKRIPTTLCQAYTIGVENKVAHIPVLPDSKNEQYFYESFITKNEKRYTYYEDAEKEHGKGYLLTHDYEERKRTLDKIYVSPWGAICPDYDVNYPYLNSLFTGTEFKVCDLGEVSLNSTFTPNYYQVLTPDGLKNEYVDAKIIGVEDNTKLVGIGECMMSARAGEAEEAHRFCWVGFENKKGNGGNNITRGSFGNYLGIVGVKDTSHLISIKIPGYDPNLLDDYIPIRANDKTPFYAISDRLIWDSYKFNNDKYTELTCYRGDCYISKFTHRLNRNFADPTAPANDEIVDNKCWTRGIKYEDEVLKVSELDKINLGDVNAVKMGTWVSMIVRSNINHSIRSIDASNVDEKIMFGNDRGFYPYLPISTEGSFKIPESRSYNKGFERGVSEQIYMELPTVPYMRNQFSTRIAYSNIKISSAFQNAYRVFQGTQYRDYPITYGQITKLLELNGSLICILEHGILRIPVNERAVAANGDGGMAYINTHNVLPENPMVISDIYGSQWSDSIIQTPAGIYGVDTIGKKIWFVDRQGGFNLMSDFHIQSFLNDHITFNERELTPVIGIRNVKTHYNAFKKDVVFTFYDDTNTFEETAWSICWNEIQGMWVTFYSWIPSLSENIYNQFFSFDRETSKYISKLGLTANKNAEDGFYLDNVIINNIPPITIDGIKLYHVGNLIPRNKSYKGNDTEEKYTFEIVRDIWQNFNDFKIIDKALYCKKSYEDLVSKTSIENIKELYLDGVKYIYNDGWTSPTVENIDSLLIAKLNQLRLKEWKNKFSDKNMPVYYLNIRMNKELEYTGQNASYAEMIASNKTTRSLDGGYTDYTIAVIPKENLDALSTDFWKHGQSGIIDITEDVKPTHWYGKQHPFEFEFVVNEKPLAHKIFDSLRILSNSAEPESFHYEIIGDSYEFSKDKKNMYIRQEATKELFQYNGMNISFDKSYKNLKEEHRLIPGFPELTEDCYDKSTLFPMYYYRTDNINLVENSYHQKTSDGVDYKGKSGAEIVRDKTLEEYLIWNHQPAVTMIDGGRLRGNMQYKEDSWYIQINPLNIVQCNESRWANDKIPVELGQYPIPEYFKEYSELDDPFKGNRDMISWNWEDNQISEAKIKDKWIKIRVRYSGEKLAIISAIQTLFSISYS